MRCKHMESYVCSRLYVKPTISFPLYFLTAGAQILERFLYCDGMSVAGPAGLFFVGED